MGLGIYLEKVSLRLYGVDTPEIRTKNKKEKEAGLKVKKIVKNLIEGKVCEIETLAKPDKYGRVLARVKCGVGDLTKFLIAEKLAYPYFGEKKQEFKPN